MDKSMSCVAFFLKTWPSFSADVDRCLRHIWSEHSHTSSDIHNFSPKNTDLKISLKFSQNFQKIGKKVLNWTSASAFMLLTANITFKSIKINRRQFLMSRQQLSHLNEAQKPFLLKREKTPTVDLNPKAQRSYSLHPGTTCSSTLCEQPLL